MTELDLKKIIEINEKLLLLLGYAIGILPIPDLSVAHDVYFEKYNWLLKAVENTVYLNKPFPKMP